MCLYRNLNLMVIAGFLFDRPPSAEVMDPKACVGCVASDEDSSLFMRIDFPSCLDGTLTSATRQPVDIVFVVDVR